MMNRNDIEEKNAANGKTVKNDRNRSRLALFALVSLSALLSPVLIEDKHDISAESSDMLALDTDELHTGNEGSWRDNEMLMCALISAGAIISMLVVYFGCVRARE